MALLRDDNNIESAISNIYTSSYIRTFTKSTPRILNDKNDFISNIYGENLDRNIIAHYVPKVDYDQLIFSIDDRYEISSQSDYYDKLIVYNVVNYNFRDVVVGIRYKFKY